MTWQPVTHQWPESAQTIQTSSESVLIQVNGVMDTAISKIKAIENKVTFARHPLSSDAESLLANRQQLEALLVQGQILCVHPYQHQVGSKNENGDHLSAPVAVQTLANKLIDVQDDYLPAGDLYVQGIMIAEQNISDFALHCQQLFNVLPIPELGIVARRSNQVLGQAQSQFIKPLPIMQPRFKPQAHVNVDPLRQVLQYQGGQVAQLESIAGDKQTPVQKLQALANKRNTQLSTWHDALNQLKNSDVAIYQFSATGKANVISTRLAQSSMPGHDHTYTFAALFISATPLTFLSELFA
ncbi:hypothetical protein [Moritella yayanosii]|uniref:Uncharacterized protein n=1 Tax=Moritella yayanosii TaxID=69539 RepID=A0A330M1Y5_9GAMM|nr:hypothetical protein [Moritella yayanosii]SQD80455.1 conserved protein of unknown function, 40-50% identity to uncharacterized protein from Vibiro [Moritella yayanosii]